MRKLLLLLLLLSILTNLQSVTAQDSRIKEIRLSKMDLTLDGSITPQTVNVTGFPVGSWITVIILNLHFEDNSVDFSGWGTGAALTNGTAALIEGVSFIPTNLTNNHGFGHLSGDLTIFTDDKNPIDNHFVSRFPFWEVIPPYGLKWNSNASLQFIVQDNITASVDEFEVIVEGFSFADASGDQGSDSPDAGLNNFFDNQLRVFVGIFPWLLIIAFVVGLFIFAKKQFKF